MKKILKGDISPVNGIILDEKEYKKVQKDKEILDKIDEMYRKQKCAVHFDKNT